MALLLSVLEQGMIYGILALGVYITYKILDFPDLTVDGSFPFGAAITVRLINGFGVPAILTLPIAFLGGALVGICTGLIHVKLKVRDLLSGIIMMTGLYTINLWVAGSGYVQQLCEQHYPLFFVEFQKCDHYFPDHHGGKISFRLVHEYQVRIPAACRR